LIFTQPVYLAFFAVCFCIHWSLRTQRQRKAWLLLCSYFFYGWWDWRFLSLIFASTLVDFVAGRVLHASEEAGRRRLIVGLSVAANLGILGVFKYYDFFVESGAALLNTLGLETTAPTLRLILPVGISFFTFQSMSYTLDIYRSRLEPTRRFFDFALYVSFFPQLVAGPIVRARSFLPQLELVKHLRQIEGRSLLLLFLAGFFKKACVADNIGRLIDPVFAEPSLHGGAELAASSLLYSAQIYCDFSGYTDMAIAGAGLLGYRLVANFEFPFLSPNVREFWRRWHMSLSTWLRDYLYISLGGNRGSRARVNLNLLVTMVLGGLWHGASLTYVVWGFLHGLALVVHRSLAPSGRSASAQALGVGSWSVLGVHALKVVTTFLWVVACFTVFRAVDLDTAGRYFSTLVSWPASSGRAADLWLLFAGLAFWHVCNYRLGHLLRQRIAQAPDALFFGAYGAACASALYFVPASAEPFIYFQF
jgi:alginate O-acetyltransferase complex protein AlgI